MSDKSHWRGAKLLIKWRGERSQQDAADLIGIDLARYNAFENDRARPGLDWAVTIETVTKGEVPARSWAEEKRARAS
jgi:DNA-binding XRE family transcriptional regulator